MRNAAILFLAAGAASSALAQPATAIRFSNGTNAISVAPGSMVHVEVFATGMPVEGTPIPWTTPPGTGQVGGYAGFLSVLFDVRGVTTSTAVWSSPAIAPGHGFMSTIPGIPSGTNVNAINVGVGFNPPVTGQEFMLWSANVTVGSADVSLSTLVRPVGFPPETGFEVALSGLFPGPPPLNVSHFVQTMNGTALITVPAPPVLAALLAGALLARRRRRS